MTAKERIAQQRILLKRCGLKNRNADDRGCNPSHEWRQTEAARRACVDGHFLALLVTPEQLGSIGAVAAAEKGQAQTEEGNRALR